MKIILLLLFPCCLIAQDLPIDGLYWRNIGPANQGGRVVDIEALDNEFRKVWMATGSGGVWHSDNAGTTWTPIFENYSTASIGDIAVYQQDPSIIWVGTGEANNRNSVSWGDGIYKSTDGGKTFTQMGLRNTHQIARVVTITDKPDEVCVCAIGHLWGKTGDRGLFKTTDGGKSWTKMTGGLPTDPGSGCNDLVIDPDEPNVMYASFYERIRQPWRFESGGSQGGIFKTEDGGKTWTKLVQGLPSGPTGRIGLAIYKKDPKILMALVEAETTNDLARPGSGLYRSEDGGQNWTYVNTYNNRPFYYSQVRINPRDDQRVYVLTTRFMVSEDGGKTLRNGSQDEEVHGDFHAMWLDPNDVDRYYLGADKGISITHDHGIKFQLFDNLPIAQFYRISYDFRDPFYVYGGLQDNGFYATSSFSRDIRGILNDSNWKVHWGDGQFSESDPDDWRTLYTSSENASLNLYDPVTHRIKNISPRRKNITNINDYYSADLHESQLPLRFNWSAPFKMDVQKNIYVAGNHIFRSSDQGKTWTIISPDISTNDPEKIRKDSGGITPDNTGAETHCSASTLSISELDPKLIWVGTDDGQLHVTSDGGEKWNSVREKIKGVPENIWVSRIESSRHEKGRAYVSFDGHRSDINAPFLYVTENLGRTWRSLSSGLPADMVIRVVREDPVNPHLLYIGTETGVWISLDRGEHWRRFMKNMPTVSVYDLAIHKRDHALIAASHGRSLFIMDNIQALQQMSPDIRDKQVHLFQQPVATLWENVSRGGQRGHFWYGGENPDIIRPTSSIPRARFEVDIPVYYYLAGPDSAEVSLRIVKGNESRMLNFRSAPGIQKYHWDRRFDARPYSQEELEMITVKFSEMARDTANMSFSASARRRVADANRFLLAYDSVDVQRRIVTEYHEYLDLDPGLGVVTGMEGVYQVSIRVGAEEVTTTLTVRLDPLLKDD